MVSLDSGIVLLRDRLVFLSSRLIILVLMFLLLVGRRGVVEVTAWSICLLWFTTIWVLLILLVGKVLDVRGLKQFLADLAHMLLLVPGRLLVDDGWVLNRVLLRMVSFVLAICLLLLLLVILHLLLVFVLFLSHLPILLLLSILLIHIWVLILQLYKSSIGVLVALLTGLRLMLWLVGWILMVTPLFLRGFLFRRGTHENFDWHVLCMHRLSIVLVLLNECPNLRCDSLEVGRQGTTGRVLILWDGSVSNHLRVVLLAGLLSFGCPRWWVLHYNILLTGHTMLLQLLTAPIPLQVLLVLWVCSRVIHVLSTVSICLLSFLQLSVGRVAAWLALLLGLYGLMSTYMVFISDVQDHWILLICAHDWLLFLLVLLLLLLVLLWDSLVGILEQVGTMPLRRIYIALKSVRSRFSLLEGVCKWHSWAILSHASFCILTLCSHLESALGPSLVLQMARIATHILLDVVWGLIIYRLISRHCIHISIGIIHHISNLGLLSQNRHLIRSFQLSLLTSWRVVLTSLVILGLICFCITPPTRVDQRIERLSSLTC